MSQSFFYRKIILYFYIRINEILGCLPEDAPMYTAHCVLPIPGYNHASQSGAAEASLYTSYKRLWQRKLGKFSQGKKPSCFMEGIARTTSFSCNNVCLIAFLNFILNIQWSPFYKWSLIWSMVSDLWSGQWSLVWSVVSDLWSVVSGLVWSIKCLLSGQMSLVWSVVSGLISDS